MTHRFHCSSTHRWPAGPCFILVFMFVVAISITIVFVVDKSGGGGSDIADGVVGRWAV